MTVESYVGDGLARPEIDVCKRKEHRPTKKLSGGVAVIISNPSPQGDTKTVNSQPSTVNCRQLSSGSIAVGASGF
ncbi:MAG: hypothetical protein FWH05_08565 [Oscillospiraceae bacterium]|nr:hypothetical protein [Oscillospiraceae bacterium]